MECNKEEARRAKEIAERKMQNKDFLGAKKVVLKAQQLFPELENISQMLTVCEVHCCAAAMINGEMDWYKILQVEQFADEFSIKKQYRKLALQLHPDKNKSTGAEAAFKLIGEAHMTLSDQGKRSLYDNKRRLNALKVLPRQPPQQPTRPYFAKTQPGVPGNFASSTAYQFGSINQTQPSESNSQSFWTMCTNCCGRYEYPRTLINKPLHCQRCHSKFTAHELHEQAVPVPGANSGRPSKHTQKCKQGLQGRQSHMGNSSNGDVGGGPAVQKSRSSSGINIARGSVGSASKENNVHFDNINLDKKKKKKKKKEEPQAKRSAVNAKQKRGKKSVVESCDSDSCSDSVDILTEQGMRDNADRNAGTSTGRYPRRSNRAKQNITYNEEANEDGNDFVSPHKRRKNTNSKDVDGIHNNNDAKCTVDSNSNDSPGPASFSYPDAEFGNFESERVETKFEAGQIWAVYDDLDGMPRYYVLIREVCAREFRLYFNWLEHNALNNIERAWTKAELPVASGNYRLGESESTGRLQMFSHLMCWEKGRRRITYNIYPKRGEVWALYKGWDLKWSSDADSHRFYEYEVVEILLDNADSSDIIVVRHLVKIEGFLSLFMPAMDKGTHAIPSLEILRFSHRVPSYRLTGAEREGTLKGCLELDVASLPTGFADVFPSISLDNAALKAGKFDATFTNLCGSVAAEEDVISNTDAADASPLPDTKDYPPGEFHNFQEDNSIEKIERGQIWALYSDVGQYPRYYAEIRSVEGTTVFVSWVELLPQRKDETTWAKKGLPCCCGRFKAERKVNSYDTTDNFSHVVHAVSGKRDHYEIYPQSDEVWALYKDWSIEWTQSDLEKCDYDVVEVLECTGSVIRTVVLAKVDGHSAVFMPEREGETARTLEIPVGESLRFSHQIPAFRITDGESSELQGYWELHSMSVPRKFL